MSVAGGATLGGTGTVGPLTSTGGTVSPGESPGILQSGALSMDAASALAIELDGTTPGSGHDRLAVTGNASLGGASLSVSTGFTPTPGQSFAILTATGGTVSGTFAGLPDGATFASGGNTFRISYSASQVTLTALGATTLTTDASANVTIGGSIHDTATLAGGLNPTGTISFELYGPDDATCAGAPVFTDDQTVTGNDDYDSASFIPTAAGTYRWVASYSGDANNLPAAGACNDAGESVVVAAPPPVPTPPGPPGPSVCDRLERLLAKLNRKKRRVQRAGSAHKLRFIKRNIRDTKQRLRSAGC